MPAAVAPGIDRSEQIVLERFMQLSIAAAVVTIAVKMAAAWVTGSVGFLSDALESLVNLVAAVAGFIALRVAAKPADEDHHFGHGHAEYVSALLEGALIFLAAGAIIYTGLDRLLHPQPLEAPGMGLVLSVAASVLNLVVGLVLLRAGKRYRSATLNADGHHLLTDVWTSAGVVLGVAAVWATGWVWLDPVIALAVGINIIWTGYRLSRASVRSLLSEALPPEENQALDELLDHIAAQAPVEFTQRRTMASGRQRFVYLIMDVPPQWSVQASHEHADMVEERIDGLFPGAEVFIHVEPAGVPHRRLRGPF
ncbi:cation diffusion facilitator family transporter [Corynebacterium lizhenjunii]|nr:cation diffusion facilitator family transporter [Corynebacterium lizhenjunii]